MEDGERPKGEGGRQPRAAERWTTEDGAKHCAGGRQK